jgi:hypothetical protein
MKNIHSYFTNKNCQLLQRQEMSGVNPEKWFIFDTNRISGWAEIPNPTIPYFNEKMESVQRGTSVGLVEISEAKMKQLRGDRC